MEIYKDRAGLEYGLAHEEAGVCWLAPMKRGFKLRAAIERSMRGLANGSEQAFDDGRPVPIPRALLPDYFTVVEDGQDEYARMRAEMEAKAIVVET